MIFDRYAQQVNDLIAQGQYGVADKTVGQEDWLNALCQILPPPPNRLFVIGNGGSATIASHFVVDCVNRLHLSAQTLHESALLTCLSNDYGYEQAFAEQIRVSAQPKDLLVVISSSGQSQNMIQATQAMLEKEGTVMSLTGFRSDNEVRQLTQQSGGLSIWLESNHYGWVETAHQLILHAIVDSLDKTSSHV